MADSHPHPDARDEEAQRETTTRRPMPPADGKKKKHANMHEGLGVWADCCSCEAEPRWAAVAEELGIDLSDYEDADADPAQNR